MSETAPEFGGWSPEKKTETKKSTKDSKKEKSESSASRFGSVAAEAAVKREGESSAEKAAESKKTDISASFEGLLQQIRGESKAKEPAKSEVPLFGVTKPDTETAKPLTPDTSKTTEAGAKEEARQDQNVESAAEPTTSEKTDETKAETEASGESAELSAEEQQELQRALQDKIELGLEDTGGQLREIPLEQADTPKAAEAAAAFAFYREMYENLRSDNEADVTVVSEAAAQKISDQIEAGQAEVAEIEADSDEAESAEAPETGEAWQQEIAEASTESTPDQEDGGSAQATRQAAGMPPLPPMPPAVMGVPGGPFDYNSPPPLPPMPSSVAHSEARSAEDSYYDARAAGAQGLLIGGVAGYFIGRHRGRKQGRKAAEKQAEPVRRNLEQRVKTLQESITTKETKIRELARDKVQALNPRKDRERFVTGMLNPEPAREAAGKPAAPQVQAETLRTPAVGRVLGEVPLAAAAIVAAPIIAERAVAGRQAEKPRAEAAPFNKNVKEYSRQELMQTAEKVKVEGTTLREMAELGQLDEPGLRRVVGEYLKGGDVTRAVSKEVREKELQYEQDPNLRHRQQGETDPRAAQAGGLIIGGLLGSGLIAPTAASAVDAGSGPASQAVDTGDSRQNQAGPQPSPEVLRQIRNKQLASVTTTTVLMVIGIVIAYIMTG